MKVQWKIIILAAVMCISSSHVYGEGIGGWVDIVQANTKEDEDGARVSTTDILNQTYSLSYDKDITPLVSYQLNFRSNFADRDVTDADDITTTTVRRLLEPSIDLYLTNPMYDLSGGYRRDEEWSTKKLKDESRETTEFYYARFNMTPRALPTLHILYERFEEFDHVPDSALNRTNDIYTIGSSYTLPSRVISAQYNINYSRNIDKTPLLATEKSERDSFNVNYLIGYTGRAWRDRVNYIIGYQGNYSRNKSTLTVSQTGNVVNERLVAGNHAHDGVTLDIGVLSGKATLSDNNVIAPAGGVEIGNDNPNNRFNNIGIQLLTQSSVDRMFIYVNKDVTGAGNLNGVSDWNVFRSNSNLAGTWQPVGIASVNVAVFDVGNNIYRYEIVFLSPQQASFIKAVNVTTTSVFNVSVTEIEALGSDNLDSNEVVDVFTSVNQRLNFDASTRLRHDLNLSVYYILNRFDQNPISFADSAGGVFSNIFSDSVSGDRNNFRSNITRNYGATVRWDTHRYLTTTFRVQRDENFDNREELDLSTNTYNLSFASEPLPTLDLHLSLIKNETFIFNEKDSTGESYLLSVGTQLYRNINMITDVGHSRSESLSEGTTSKTSSLNGTIDAHIMRNLSSTFNYGLQRTSSENDSTDTKDALLILNYQPGRFLNLSSNLSYISSDGEKTTEEGFSVDWLPVRALRLNFNYRHSDSEPGPSTTDTLNGFGIWYITKFADIRLSYGYTRSEELVLSESYNVNTNLNCRF